MAEPVMLDARKPWLWLLIALLAALFMYVTFRSYLSTDLLLHFANGFVC